MIEGSKSADLTSYDLLKALALALMFADHTGYYFCPDEMWWRVAGRLSVPIWFFLIGYARTREVPRYLWLCAAAVAVSFILSGQFLFPLNILFTLALARLLIDRVMARALRTHQTFFGILAFLALLGLPSAAVVEYGTLGLLFAMLGFLRRHKDSIILSLPTTMLFMAGAGLAYVLAQLMLMVAVTQAQTLVFFAGMIAILALLFNFRPVSYPGFGRRAGPLLPLMKLLGNRTLEIYVIHLLLFEVLAMAISPERFAFLQFRLLPDSFVRLFLS